MTLAPKETVTFGLQDGVDIFNMTNMTIQTAAYENTDSLNLLVGLSVSYAVIFIAGIIGNLSTCIVISRNRSMHTATNFYLMSLAISDLVLLLSGLPIEVHRLWNPNTYPLDEGSCIALGLASETSANATVLTITAFTVERYIAICKPFMSHTTSKLSRAVRFILIIWVFALCTAVPQAVQFGILEKMEGEEEVTSCTVVGQGVHQAFVISSCIFFIVPMVVISVLYILIGIKLQTSTVLHPKKPSVESNGRTSGINRYKSGKSQRRVIRMLVAVALSFFICWAPFHVQRLIAIYGKNLQSPSVVFYETYTVLTDLSGILYFLSTAINPILYNLMSNKFRNAFKITLAACCGHRSSTQMARYYSTMKGSHLPLRPGLNGSGTPVPLRLHRLSTATSQLAEPLPVRAQVRS